jgi:hypothetical protein
MKVLITENKLFNALYNYLNDSYDVSKIDFFNPTTFDEDEWEDTENPYITEFYNKDYVGDYDENGILFVYIVNEYYNDEPSNESFKKQTPILIVNDYGKLTTMFGERWKDPLKKWFEDNYGLPVKTIVSN